VKSDDKPGDVETPTVNTDQSGEESRTDELKDASDKTAEHVEESVESKSEGTETIVESSQDSGNTANQLKDMEPEGERKDVEKTDELKSESVEPAVDQDNVVESTPQSSSDENKIAESKDETTELKGQSDDTKASVGQVSDDTTLESTDQGSTVDQDVELETYENSKNENAGKETAIETKDGGNEAGITTVSEDKSDGTPTSEDKDGMFFFIKLPETDSKHALVKSSIAFNLFQVVLIIPGNKRCPKCTRKLVLLSLHSSPT
jgi:hypothetical protein